MALYTAGEQSIAKVWQPLRLVLSSIWHKTTELKGRLIFAAVADEELAKPRCGVYLPNTRIKSGLILPSMKVMSR